MAKRSANNAGIKIKGVWVDLPPEEAREFEQYVELMQKPVNIALAEWVSAQETSRFNHIQEDEMTEHQTEVTETVVVAEEPTIVAECPTAQPFEIGVPDLEPTRPDRAEIEPASIVNAPRRIGAYDREALEKWTVEQAMAVTLPASDHIVLVSGREAIDEARALGYQGAPKGFFSARTMGRALALLELTISAEWDWVYAPWEPHNEGGYVRGAVLTRIDGIKRVVADVTSAGVRGWYTVEVYEVTNADGELTLAVERAGSEVKVNRFYYDAPGIVDKENASLEEWCATNGVRFYPRSAPPAKHAVVADIMLNAKKFFVFDNDKGSYRQAMLDGYRDQMARAHGVDPDELYKARRAAQ